jgi:UDP-glucose 6-dehydrogenase
MIATMTQVAEVIGDGTVGKALAKAMNVTALGPSEDKVSAEVVVICVPTLTVDGTQDLSAVEQALSRIESTKLVILRSTVLPGTTERLQEKYSFPILFVPEWGFEATMDEDLANPEYYVFGTTEKSQEVLELASSVLPHSSYYEIITATAAEYSKYFANIWGSSQVVLANSFYDWVIANGHTPGTYEQAVTGATLHKNIPQWGWKIFDQGGRGASGKCLPKDLKAALGSSKLDGKARKFFQLIDKSNDEYVEESGKL